MGILKVSGRAQRVCRTQVALQNLPNIAVFYQDAQEEDDKEEEVEVCYAHLTLHPCAPESTYANRISQKSFSTIRSPEMTTEYSSIRMIKVESEPNLACTPV